MFLVNGEKRKPRQRRRGALEAMPAGDDIIADVASGDAPDRDQFVRA